MRLETTKGAATSPCELLDLTNPSGLNLGDGVELQCDMARLSCQDVWHGTSAADASNHMIHECKYAYKHKYRYRYGHIQIKLSNKAYTHTHSYAQLHAHAHSYTHMYVRMHVGMYVCMYVCTTHLRTWKRLGNDRTLKEQQSAALSKSFAVRSADLPESQVHAFKIRRL